MSKWRRALCKKRGFRSGFRRVPGPLLESKNVCGCSAVAFFTRVPPRVPAGSAGLRPRQCANWLKRPAKNGGFHGQLLEGPQAFCGIPGKVLLDSGGARAGSKFRRQWLRSASAAAAAAVAAAAATAVAVPAAVTVAVAVAVAAIGFAGIVQWLREWQRFRSKSCPPTGQSADNFTSKLLRHACYVDMGRSCRQRPSMT